MKNVIACLIVCLIAAFPPRARAAEEKPTIVLVHGAFADASSWNRVTAILREQGYPVVAVANPLRSVGGDAAYLGDLLDALHRPVVLVGHSYGGLVIGETALAGRDIRALVFVAAFAAAPGETAAGLSARAPGSTLGQALDTPVGLAGGGVDLYIRQEAFGEQFAADLPAEAALSMAASQRPVTEAALNEPARQATWRQRPSWFIYGDQDRNIPPSVLGFMADRAGSKRTIVMEGASHVVMVSHPRVVAGLIAEAAQGR